MSEFFFLSPVEVRKVTLENLEEVAEWCGGTVAQVESQRNPGRMVSYVWVPTPAGNATSSAFPNMYITKRVVVTLKDDFKITYAVFRREYFERNYFANPADAIDKTWGAKDGKKKVKITNTPPVPTMSKKAKAQRERDLNKTQSPAERRMTVREWGRDHNHIPTDSCTDACRWVVEALNDNYQQPPATDREGNPVERSFGREAVARLFPESVFSTYEGSIPAMTLTTKGLPIATDEEINAATFSDQPVVPSKLGEHDGRKKMSEVLAEADAQIVALVKAELTKGQIEDLAVDTKEQLMTETPDTTGEDYVETQEDIDAKRIPAEILYTTPVDTKHDVPSEGATFRGESQSVADESEGDVGGSGDGVVPLTPREQQLAAKTDEQLQSLLDRKKITDDEFLKALSGERPGVDMVDIPALVDVEPFVLTTESVQAVDYNQISATPEV